MKDLISSYSIEEIILFIVFLALAIRGVVSFYDWGMERIKKYVDRTHQEKKKEEELEDKVSQNTEIIQQLEKNQIELTSSLSELEKKIDLLMESDRDSIKSYLVDKYNDFMKQGSVDTYEYDCFLKRYSHYVELGGNSYIEGLVKEVEELKKRQK